jgi:general secretion pathway protein M
MIVLPGRPTSSILALSVLLPIAAIFYFACVSPFLGLYAGREGRVEQRVRLAQRYDALARQLPALRDAERNWRDRSGGELLLSGSSDALAAAALQSMLKDMTADAGADLRSSESLPAASAESFRKIGVRIVFAGNLKALVEVLRRIEVARPILSAGDIDIRNVSDEEHGGQDPGLSVTLDVYGFRAA